MKYIAAIDVMPLKELLDPQGKAVESGLKNLDINEISNIRIGKHISIEIEAPDKKIATEKVELACKKLLINPIMEQYEFKIVEKN